MPYRYAGSRDDLLARLRRIEGQVRGIARMVEADEYCVDILTQIQAANAALERVGLRLMGDHIRGCVTDAVEAGDAEGEAKIAELVSVIERFVKA
jgi:DNA-binding FrmR family transcriptional regulator